MRIIILLLLFISLTGQDLRNDKTKHYLAGLNISHSVSAAYFLWKPHQPVRACLYGFIASSLVGIGKEAIYDKMLKRGNCDNEDAYVTMWGSLVGALTFRIGIHEFYGKKRTIYYNILEN